MAVLTISGQIGSNARDVGRVIAQRLQLDYVDQEILVQAARAMGVPMESVVPFDERTAGLGERLAGLLRRFLERSATAGATDPMLGAGGLDILLGRTYGEIAAGEGLQEASEERYVETLTGIMRDLAAHDNVLIIGRGSQLILKDWPGAVHILFAAPLAYRVQSIARRDGVSEEEASKRVHDGEKGRIAFHHKFFKVDVNDPSLYHLSVNTAWFSVDAAADAAVDAVRRVTAQPQPS